MHVVHGNQVFPLRLCTFAESTPVFNLPKMHAHFCFHSDVWSVLRQWKSIYFVRMSIYAFFTVTWLHGATIHSIQCCHWDGALVFKAKACKPWSNSSESRSYTIRCCCTRVLSANALDSMDTLKCVSAFGSLLGLPACPACFAESFCIVKADGFNASWIFLQNEFRLSEFEQFADCGHGCSRFDWFLNGPRTHTRLCRGYRPKYKPIHLTYEFVGIF